MVDSTRCSWHPRDTHTRLTALFPTTKTVESSTNHTCWFWSEKCSVGISEIYFQNLTRFLETIKSYMEPKQLNLLKKHEVPSLNKIRQISWSMSIDTWPHRRCETFMHMTVRSRVCDERRDLPVPEHIQQMRLRKWVTGGAWCSFCVSLLYCLRAQETFLRQFHRRQTSFSLAVTSPWTSFSSLITFQRNMALSGEEHHMGGGRNPPNEWEATNAADGE